MKAQYNVGVVVGDDGETRYTPMSLAGERMFSVEFETPHEVDAFIGRMTSNLTASTEKEDNTRETSNEIKDRRGRMVDGIFIKEGDE